MSFQPSMSTDLSSGIITAAVFHLNNYSSWQHTIIITLSINTFAWLILLLILLKFDFSWLTPFLFIIFLFGSILFPKFTFSSLQDWSVNKIAEFIINPKYSLIGFFIVSFAWFIFFVFKYPRPTQTEN